jgi:WD repeat-containing protein mio
METAIRWSPSSTTQEQRFLYVDVIGKSFKLCRVTSVKGNELEYDVLSTHVRVPGFRAFDWSTADESLIAVGQSSGEVNILRMEGNSNESWSFPLRNQRYCNAVAFSKHGLLAGGLDKVRNDVCLNVWDVRHRINTGSSRGTLASDRQGAEPLRKLSSDPITSIKFFRNQPDTLVAGVKGQFLKLFDLRDNSSQAFLTFPTKCVHNTAIDWLDENYFASCSSTADATVCIWDRRMGPRLTVSSTNPEAAQIGPSLSLGNAIQNGSIWSLRFSKTKRGGLGVLSSNGQFKMFDIAKEYLSLESRHSTDETLGQGASTSYPEHIYTKNVRDIRHPYNHQIRGYKKPLRVVSFDFLNMSRSNEPTAVTLLGNGKVEFATVQSSAPPTRLSSQNVLVRGVPFSDRDFKTVNPRPLREKTSEIIQSLRKSAKALAIQNGSAEEQENKCLSSRENREDALFLGSVKPKLRAADALTYLNMSQARCREGYLFDCEKNKRIVSDDPDLQEFWNWVRRKLQIIPVFDPS